MGASISVNLSQKSFDAASGTSVIHVEVTVTSNAGTHNHYTDEDQGAILTVMIDDQTYSYVCPFGSEDSGTFTETVFSSDITVAHNTDSTKTLSAYASLDTGVGAGTVSDSASMSLSPSGGSSGGSGGGSDSGDEDEEGGTSGGGTGIAQGNATIVGQSSISTMTPNPVYDTTSVGYLGNVTQDYQTGFVFPYATIIKFTTPKFNGVSDSVDITLSEAATSKLSKPVNVAICTADTSAQLYLDNPASVSDPNQIAGGTIHLTQESGGSTKIPTTQLKSETTYYAILWTDETVFGSPVSIGNSTKQSINVNYVEGLVHIDSGSGFDSYQVFIDNGTSWDLAIPFNDNGTTWDLCS